MIRSVPRVPVTTDAGPHGDAARVAVALPAGGRLVAGVDDRVDPHAGVGQVDRGRVGAVVGGEHDRLLADQHAVAVQEGAGAVRRA